MSPNPAASTSAARSPTWRMPRPNTRRDRSLPRLQSIRSISFAATLSPTRLFSSLPSRIVTDSSAATVAWSSRYRSLKSRTIPRETSWSMRASPRPVDVHRPPRGEVLEAPARMLRRARRVRAPPHDLVLRRARAALPHAGRCRSACRHGAAPLRAARRAAVAWPTCGSDVAALLDGTTRSPSRDVLPRHVLGVVERCGHRDRRTGQLHRREDRVRRHRPRSVPTLTPNAARSRVRRLLRGELERRRPPRELRRGRRAARVTSEIVHLDDDAVASRTRAAVALVHASGRRTPPPSSIPVASGASAAPTARPHAAQAFAAPRHAWSLRGQSRIQEARQALAAHWYTKRPRPRRATRAGSRFRIVPAASVPRDSRTAPPPPPPAPGSSARKRMPAAGKTSPRTSTRPGRPAAQQQRQRLGSPARSAVTSSPARPVAPRRAPAPAPGHVGRGAMPRPSIFSLRHVAEPARSPSPSALPNHARRTPSGRPRR